MVNQWDVRFAGFEQDLSCSSPNDADENSLMAGAFFSTAGDDKTWGAWRPYADFCCVKTSATEELTREYGYGGTGTANFYNSITIRDAGSVVATAGNCAFTVDAGNDSVLCSSQNIQLNGSTSLQPAEISSVLWQPSAGLSDPTILNPVATVDSTITYILTVTGTGSTNLIYNGDFSLGNTGFTSGYIPGTGGISGIIHNEGEFDINTNPNNSHMDFATFGDHTTGTGNMMVVNGSGNGNTPVWCSTVAVSQNTVYDFSAWAATCNWQFPAELQFSFNGVPVGVLNLTADTGVWYGFSYSWNSGSSNSVTICIVDLNTQFTGNDYAIDDISLIAPCAEQDTVTLTLESDQEVFMHSDTSSCSDSVLLEAVEGFQDYAWYFNSQVVSQSDSLHASQSGDYTVVATSIAGCTYSDTVSVDLVSLSISLGSDTSLCGNDTLQLAAPAGFTAYQWMLNGNPLNDSLNSIQAVQSGSYMVTVTDSAGCTASDNIVVNTATQPSAEFTFDIELNCNGAVLTLENNSTDAQTFFWSFGDGATSQETAPQHLYAAPVETVITLVASSGSCSDTATAAISIKEVILAIDSLPNFFSPNGDGSNDCFELNLPENFNNCYDIRVFNRWGQPVFASSPAQWCWNGSKDNDGEPLPDGTYYYILSAGTFEVEGAVTLAR